MRLLVALCALVAALVAPASALAQCPQGVCAVTNRSDSGPGSLRAALVSANATPAVNDTIFFANTAFSGPNPPYTIALSTPLPAIEGPAGVTFDDSAVRLTSQDSLIAIDGAGVSDPGAIGLEIHGASLIRGLVVKNFNLSGIVVGGGLNASDGANTRIVSTQVLDNKLDGIDILADNVSVTDSTIAGNEFDGVSVIDGTGAVLERNIIGRGSGGDNETGVHVFAAGTTIGGATAGDGNRIAGNRLAEIHIEEEIADGTIIRNNLIGTTDGVGALGAATERVLVTGGGDDIVLRSNTIASSSVATVSMNAPGSTGVLVQDNLIGLNGARTGPLGPSASVAQVLWQGPELTLQGNEIGNSAAAGVQAAGTGLLIRGNSIGTPAGSTTDTGNLQNGISLGAGSGTVDGNVVAYAVMDGLRTAAGSGPWKIRGNRFFSNGQLAYDLADNGQDGGTPALTVERWANGYKLTGEYTGAAGALMGIDLFSNPACDPSGFGEGELLHEQFDVTLGADGKATFTREAIGSLAFSSSTLRVGEKAGKATLTVQRTPPPNAPAAFAASATPAAAGGQSTEIGACTTGTNVNRPVTIAVSTAAGSAADGDFTATQSTVDFGDAALAKTVDIPITDDLEDESDESFTVTLSSPQGSTLGAQASVVVTITDDEQPSTAGPGGGGPGGGGPDVRPRPNEEPDSDITRAPRKPRRGTLGVLRGEAVDDDGELARVELALTGVTGKGARRRCVSLRPNGTFRRTKPKGKRCPSPRFVTVRGTLSWRLATRGRLPKGTYTLISRAVDTRGAVESSASSDDGNLVRIRVK